MSHFGGTNLSWHGADCSSSPPTAPRELFAEEIGGDCQNVGLFSPFGSRSCPHGSMDRRTRNVGRARNLADGEAGSPTGVYLQAAAGGFVPCPCGRPAFRGPWSGFWKLPPGILGDPWGSDGLLERCLKVVPWAPWAPG
jgi:hypothetical protein